jgi:hypothetical protein
MMIRTVRHKGPEKHEHDEILEINANDSVK